MSFHVGQKVVCVDASAGGRYKPPPLARDSVYTVYGTYECGCGRQSLNVGIPDPDGRYGRTICECGMIEISEDGAWKVRASRFRPLDTLTETMDRLEKEGCPQEVILEELCCN